MDNHQDREPGRPRFTTIEANWVNFNAVDVAPSAPDVQRREMRRAFMAGGASTLMLVVDAYVYGDLAAAIATLRAELQTYLTIADAKRRPARSADERAADIAENIVDTVKPVFAGAHPAIQGAALADLLALWLAGHPAEKREKLLALHVDGVRALIAPNDQGQQHGS